MTQTSATDGSWAPPNLTQKNGLNDKPYAHGEGWDKTVDIDKMQNHAKDFNNKQGPSS